MGDKTQRLSALLWLFICLQGLSPGAVVKATCLEKSVIAGSISALAFKFQRNEMFLPCWLVKLNIVGSLRDGEVASSASDRQGLIFESFVWGVVPSDSSHHPHEVLLAQLSLYVHTGGLKPDSFYFHLFVYNALKVVSRYRWKRYIDVSSINTL